MGAPHESDFESLLAHSGWLASLARRLVRDPTLADDLVQDTWCAALSAPRTDLQSERGWLATLLANLARARARSDAARARRERDVARHESVDGPDHVVARAEAQRRLLEHVLALDEPYRSTLLSRYVDGRAPAEIARAQRVNESTVRTRLQRAHERLRERLKSAERDGGLLGLAPLLALPAGSVAGGAPVWAGATKSVLTKAAAAGMGVGIVSTTSKVIVVVALGGCAWLAWDRLDGRTPEPPGVSRASDASPALVADPGVGPAPVDGERLVLAPADAAAPAPPTWEPAAAAPAPAGKATLELVFTRDGAPVSGVAVWIAEADSWPMVDCLDLANQPPERARSVRTDAAGVAAFAQLRGWTYRIGYDVGGRAAKPTRFVEQDVHAGYRHEVRLGHALLRGRVHDERGRLLPRAGLSVRARVPDASHFVLTAMAQTDEHGDYAVGDLAAGRHDVVLDPDGRFDGLGQIQQQVVELAAGQERVVDFGSAAPAPIWSGRVLNALGEPFGGIPPPGSRADRTASLQLVSHADGSIIRASIGPDARFQVGFRPGSWQVTAWVPGCPDGGLVIGGIELPPNDLVRDVVIPGARLRGRITRASEPDRKLAPDDVKVSVRLKGHDYPSAFREVLIDADGGYHIDGLEAGAWTVSVYPGRFVEGDTVEVTIGVSDSVVVQDLKLLPP